jgi:hypothetical protein
MASLLLLLLFVYIEIRSEGGTTKSKVSKRVTQRHMRGPERVTYKSYARLTQTYCVAETQQQQ